MKAFRFTLEAVRTVRQRRENEALEKFAQALLARQVVLDLLESIDERIGQSRAQIRKLLTDGCGALEASQAYDCQSALEKRRDECVAALGQAERRVNAASQAMLAARQQREIVDIYCDKQKALYLRMEMREEQKILDEFSTRRAPTLHLSPPVTVNE
ncbi:MAG TPA: flagellar export protein FliJ [Verrucomicrobiae bacterium]|jgi:flagellar export protein FliJ|nr:flagellar export protein FliJ [Verrucomicrobiae bacterium]